MDASVRLLLVLAAVVIGLYLGLFIHLCGHLLGAVLVGLKPLTFRLGGGKQTALLRCGDLHFQLRLFPVGGFVVAVTNTAAWFRLRVFTFIIAGPIASLASAWMLWWVVEQPQVFSTLPSWASDTLPFVLGTQAALFLGSIVPRRVWMYGTCFQSDGAELWMCLRMTRVQVAQRLISQLRNTAGIYFARGEEERALQLLEEAGKREGCEPSDPRRQWICWLLSAGKKAQADTAIKAFLDDACALGLSYSRGLDALASIPLYTGLSGFLEPALGYIDEAIRVDPEAITLKGTKGALLVEVGRCQEGMELLQEVMARTDEKEDLAIGSYYIALAIHKMGGLQKARLLLEEATRRYPRCQVRTHVTDLCRKSS
ncbi:hypothetical protein CfE428DRAFT_0117 [Chthoniobacter flavus Ellin428]|uniref:Peptidase M50 domain-containing protein n=1 Tax=Chthoniobacter flavus Ellin428 TaxID=497964 RepID=B4CTV4_9BACT|nr:site-2 protease family protein [Chthoniobacter flavus]EDY21992.1 hypothetical protein CfE428DRAFT_0117 [Chthoniobacter flavus Ellin428]TCO89379.1 peptidase M50-like protein [Chthoniobacter flavus]